ncbi:glycosyltransferase [Williamsia muralis]|uniref:glycosyltransferase n=1 Tax=Williamsia marianensis TaxID=85044 RepID=UPI003F1413D0
MKIVLSCNGSRGDVQPAMALGSALAHRNHEVTLAVPPNLVSWAADSGLATQPCGIDTDELLGSDLVTRDLKSSNPAKRLRAVSEITLRGGSRLQHDLHAVGQGADVIIGGSAGQERILNVAESLGIPYVPLHYCPMRKNSVVSPVPWLPPSITAHSWTLIERILWHTSASTENELRSELGLGRAKTPTASRIAGQGMPELQAYDPLLFPGLGDEWGRSRPLVGFLEYLPSRPKLQSDWTHRSLVDWLDAGPAPLYVGFGSMKIGDPSIIEHAVVATAERLGLRVLLVAGGNHFSIDPADDRFFVTSTVDHKTALPRCTAAVHHGGAGSTAASLRAGLPTGICWFGADQPMWGQQLTRLGVGVSTPISRIGSDKLTSLVSALIEPARRTAAQAMATSMIKPECAAASAVTIIEETVSPHLSNRGTR